jgi:hypothetical protein
MRLKGATTTFQQAVRQARTILDCAGEIVASATASNVVLVAQRTAIEEQLGYNLLFRWFVGLNTDDPIWDVTVFTKNRERLVSGNIDELTPSPHRATPGQSAREAGRHARHLAKRGIDAVNSSSRPAPHLRAGTETNRSWM